MPVVAVGAVGIIVLALLAILIVLASELLAKLVVNLVSRLPVVGGYLGGAARSFADTVIADTKAACYAVMHPIANFFYAIGQHLVGMWDAAANFATETADALDRLYSNTLPRLLDRAIASAVHTARAIATDLVHGLRATLHLAVHELDADIHSIESRITTAEHELAHDIAGVEAKVAGDVGQLAHAIEAAEVKAVGVATSLANSVRADLTSAIDAVETQAAQALASSVTSLGNLIDATASAVLDQADADIAAAVAGIDTVASQVATAAWPVVTDIVDGIKGLTVPVEDVIEGAVGAIPAAIPTTLEGTLAATMALATVGADFANECGLNMCSNLSGLGNFLASLGADLADGALFGLIALMVADPQAGADVARATLGPLVSGASSLAGELVHIGEAVA